MKLTALQYAENRLNLLKDEMGSIKYVTINHDGNLILEFENGMTIQVHQDEVKHQAITHLESEIAEIKN